MSEGIIIGITPVNEHEHVVCARYNAHVANDDPLAIEVVEIANARLAHTRVEGSHTAGRIAVFSRYISTTELDERKSRYNEDPENYLKAIYKGTTL